MELFLRPRWNRRDEYEAILDCTDAQTGDNLLAILYKIDRDVYIRIMWGALSQEDSISFENARMNGENEPASFSRQSVYIPSWRRESGPRSLAWRYTNIVELKCSRGIVSRPSCYHLEEDNGGSWRLRGTTKVSSQTRFLNPTDYMVFRWKWGSTDGAFSINPKNSVAFQWDADSGNAFSNPFIVLLGQWGHFTDPDVKIACAENTQGIESIAIDHASLVQRSNYKLPRDFDQVMLDDSFLISASVKRLATAPRSGLALEINLTKLGVSP